MVKKRNELGQYIRNNDFDFSIRFPSPLKLIKYLMMILIVSPWLFILLYKLNFMDLVQKTMENLFLIKSDDPKKSNGFF